MWFEEVIANGGANTKYGPTNKQRMEVWLLLSALHQFLTTLHKFLYLFLSLFILFKFFFYVDTQALFSS